MTKEVECSRAWKARGRYHFPVFVFFLFFFLSLPYLFRSSSPSLPSLTTFCSMIPHSCDLAVPALPLVPERSQQYTRIVGLPFVLDSLGPPNLVCRVISSRSRSEGSSAANASACEHCCISTAHSDRFSRVPGRHVDTSSRMSTQLCTSLTFSILCATGPKMPSTRRIWSAGLFDAF